MNILNVHKPVLIDRILEFIENRPNLSVFDGTFGSGGYTAEFLKRQFTVYACDLDLSAVEAGKKRFKNFISDTDQLGLNNIIQNKIDSLKLEEFQQTETQTDINGNPQILINSENRQSQTKPQLYLVQSSFAEYISTFHDNNFDYIILDLGFSSNQLEFSNRGFSYLKPDEPFDLRFDIGKGLACWLKIKKFNNPSEFYKIIYRYSGEKLSPQIGKRLIELVRNKKNSEEFITVREVTDVVKSAIPEMFKKKTNAILSRVWQALRIWTNDEFSEIEKFLPKALKKLKSKGKLMIVDFHSLEDKIITNFMRQAASPVEVDDFGNKRQLYKILTPKAIVADVNELKENSRARSAKLRILQKVV